MRSYQNKKLVLIGGGGHCRSVIDSIASVSGDMDIVITDPGLPRGSRVDGCEVDGEDAMLPELFQRGYTDAFITVGSIRDNKARMRIYERIAPIGFSFSTVIDSSAALARDVITESGVFVGKKAVINCGSVIREFSLINTGAIIEHECTIGRFTHISVGAVVCGGCQVDEGSFVGANVTVIQGVKIGKNCVIGAGSVVLSDVPDNTVVTGVWK